MLIVDCDLDCRYVMSVNDYIVSLRDLLGMYICKYIFCSLFYWFLFFLFRMLFEICIVCFKNEREMELMILKICL